MSAGRRVLWVVTGVWLPVLLVYLWWTLSAESSNPYFPPLSLIWERFQEIWLSDQFGIHVVPSLRNLLIGYVLAVVLGVSLGALVGNSRTLTRYVEPLIDFQRSIPAVALVPIFIIFFGLDANMRIASITFATLLPIMIATIQAVRSTNAVLLDTAKAFRLSRMQILWRVRVPSGSPMIFSGLQVGLQIAFVVTIASEYLGSGFGIGAFTLIAADSFLILDAWTGVILMGLLGYFIFLFFDLFERVALRWYFGEKKIS
jgi:ABC-type nitrate/sulfonate/bicarbonate transport system permease component